MFQRSTRHRHRTVAILGAAACAVAGLSAVSWDPASAGAVTADVTQRLDDNVTTPTNGTDYFSYPSNWPAGCCFGDLYGGGVHYALTGGAPAVFTFTGTDAVIYAVKDVDQGQVSYAVDGGPARTVDLYSATRVAQAAAFDTGALAEGSHTVTITPLGTKNPASSNTIVTVDSAVFTGPVQPQTFSVDLTANTGPFLGGAAGTLYGQYQPGVPSQNLLDGFGQRTLATKAQDGQQHPGADALEVGPSFFAAGGTDEYIYMTDVYRNFPYERTSIAQYQSYLTTEVNQAKASPNAAHIVLIPFNEPDGNWYGGMLGNRDTLHAFESEWLSDVTLIKSLWPTARIAGPNTAGYDQDSFIDFLKFAKANNVMPDVVTWHTLGAPSGVDGTVQNFRQTVEPAVGISNTPVNLDEYATPTDLDNPAAMVPWIAAIERNKVDGDLAYWRVDGTLADSIAQQNTPNAQWWLYNWYSHMSGNTVNVTSPAANADGTGQGVATVDTARRQAQLIISGGNRFGPASVQFNHVDSATFGSSVRVTVLADRWSGNLGAAAQPDRVADALVKVVNGTVTVPMSLDPMTAYQVILSPGGGSNTPLDNAWRSSYEAEDAALTGSARVESQGGDATSGGSDVTGLSTGSSASITFNTAVPSTGTYTFRVFGSALAGAPGADGPSTVYARVDGGSAVPVAIPETYRTSIWTTSDTTLKLSAGKHQISLSTNGDGGGATSGLVSIDRVDLIAQTNAARVIEAEQAQLAGTAPSYDNVGQTGAASVLTPKNASETFWVSSTTDGYSDLGLRIRNNGSVNLTVNGIKIGTVRSSSDWTTASTTTWLQQGVNKVVVTGATGNVRVDNLTVRRNAAADRNAKTVQAESGTTSGITHVQTGLSQASGGAAVADIGPGESNSLTLAVQAARSGAYVATLRFSNPQQLPSNHYNPDLMSRSALVSVNGGAPVKVAFGPTYDWNQFFTVAIPMNLPIGTSSVKIWSVQQYNWDGKTVGTVFSGDGGVGSEVRTNQAADIDQITVAPATS